MMTTMFDVMYCGFIISDDFRFGGLAKFRVVVLRKLMTSNPINKKLQFNVLVFIQTS